jgi:sulfur carrier protein
VRFFAFEAAMTVTVNGEPMELPEGLTIDGLLGQLKIRREYTAVALNRDVWPKSRYAETVLKNGDRVEIVRPMGGG